MAFYKNDNGSLLEAPNYVYGPNFTLSKENKDTYTYPVEGWKWFDAKETAIAEYGIVLPEEAQN